MILRCCVLGLVTLAWVSSAQAKVGFKYVPGTVVYAADSGLICIDPAALEEGHAMLELKAYKAFRDSGKCEILKETSTSKGIVLQNVGPNAKILLSLPDGDAVSIWARIGVFISAKDMEWNACYLRDRSNTSCAALADTEHWED